MRWWLPRLLIALLPAVSTGCLAAVEREPGPPAGERPTSIHVVTHSWHTGLAVRVADTPPGRWPGHETFAGAEYVEIGWGDRDYFMAASDTLGLGLNAAFRSRASAVRIIWFDGPVEEYFVESDVVEIPLSRRDVEQLVTFIRDSYALTASGQLIDLGPGPIPGSRYYLARGRYHLLNTSNRWTAQALRAAGVPIASGYTLTAASVICQTVRLGRVVRLREPCPPPDAERAPQVSGRSAAPLGSLNAATRVT